DFEFDDFQPQPVMERLWGIVAKYKPQVMTSYEGKDITDLHDIRRPMMQGTIVAFSLDKVEKLVIGSWAIMKKLCVVFILGYPADSYDFPVLASDITEKQDQAVLILDLHSLADLVMKPEYRERYLDPLASVWKKYLDLNNDYNPNAWYRSLLSPYAITSRLNMTADDRSPAVRQLDCLVEYTEYFFDNLVVKAKPVSPEEAQKALVRKQAIKDLYRTKDPGLGPLETAFGRSEAERIARLLY
ncbi:MAG: hypothetical protein N3E40_08130, partial [Dehalococcoidia bacterium]|nr:hypothetical protein [Dehalococcoidia bacterium]